MKFYIVLVSMLMQLVACTVDEELQMKYQTMTRKNFIDYFNEKNLSWKIKQYTNITINFNNETFSFNDDVLRTNRYEDLRVKYHHPLEVGPLPENFDARETWPSCYTISEIYDQKTCNSCWAHGVANTASDRICIHTHELVVLSEQDLECSHENRSVCITGYPYDGFQFWKESGIVTRHCKPYVPEDIYRRGCIEQCLDPLRIYKLDKHYAQEVYIVPHNDYQIKAELYLNGPIMGVMYIYEDFMDVNGNGYDSGIYVHTHGLNHLVRHAVRIIGYGVENGVDYWLVANTWSKAWGENGFFRIKRFQKSIMLENFLLTGIPEPYLNRWNHI